MIDFFVALWEVSIAPIRVLASEPFWVYPIGIGAGFAISTVLEKIDQEGSA